MRLLGKINTVLGVVAVAVVAIYWFDLDNLMIKKAEPKLRQLAELKKAMKAKQSAQSE